MFIGEYAHTVDEKRRISLPAKFRKELGSKVVVTRGLDNCLFLFPHKAWQAISEETAKLGLMQHDTRGFTRFMFSGASEIDVDSMGRILIPDYLREFAGVKSSAIFAGVHNRIEIWNEKRWESYKKKIEGEAEEMAEKLSSIGLR
ncbi:division/cell wall cluster transcriptional repressor MraZ [Candidatus Parcubacteria bacterium]|nr:division/cell wall cluster transcriptional repressor MraZ [Candidatus Parcubacteria bacterium]